MLYIQNIIYTNFLCKNAFNTFLFTLTSFKFLHQYLIFLKNLLEESEYRNMMIQELFNDYSDDEYTLKDIKDFVEDITGGI